MKDHYDIALLGIWWGSNYGSVLNGYAVYKILKSMGLSVLLVNKHNAAKKDWELTGTHNTRFMKKFYQPDEVSPVIPFDHLHELNKICDIFLTGSDQIWNYNINCKFDMVFLLNFVDDDKRKISFATSFGHGYDKTPEDRLEDSKKLFHRYNAISVREKSGIEICNDIFGVNASQVIEPVFCLEDKEYYELADKSEMQIPVEPNEKYILTYILDPTPEKREAIKYYSEISGMKAINILDGNHALYDLHYNQLNLPNTMGKIGSEDMLLLYRDCSFVITDSFHGTAFSVIFEKPFISITNMGRGAVRFGELLQKLNLTDRLVSDPRYIPHDKRFFSSIDFSEAKKTLASERKKSIDWLKKAITTPLNELPDISINKQCVASLLKKEMCMGCSACVNICPHDALFLEQDSLGYYRAGYDHEKCTDCGVCSKICPALNPPEKNNSDDPHCYAFIAKNEKVLRDSSSGGFFSTISDTFFDEGGLVYGVGWDDDFSAVHMSAKNKNELKKLKKSKYLQSYLGNIFTEVKNNLDSGVKVLFSGCPCQIAGLKNYLRKDYDNLLLIDLLCGNSPSAGFFKKYLEDSFPEGIKKYEFRHKNNEWNPGWRWDSVKITHKNGFSEIRLGSGSDDYQRVYHNHTMCAPHCEKCSYQEIPRFGDITIGDFWGFGNKKPEIDVKKGVSVVLLNNKKGIDAFNKIPSGKIGYSEQVPLEWLGGNGYALKGKHNHCSPNRSNFYKEIKTNTFSDAVNIALKPYYRERRHLLENNSDRLLFSSLYSKFRFDPNIWKESFYENKYSLSVTAESVPAGLFACLFLKQSLKKGKSYICKMRFKVQTTSDVVNFHIKDSGSRLYQIIYSYKTDKENNDWIELKYSFIPNYDIFDEFMIGASQIRGNNNYICFDYIYISEEYGM